MTLPVSFEGNAGRGNSTIEAPASITTTNSFNEILAFARKQQASDIHLSAESQITLRQFGQLKAISTDNLTSKRLKEMVIECLPHESIELFVATGDCELIYSLTGLGRFRITMIKQHHGLDVTVRLIPMEIPKFESTGMPASCANLTKWAQGLVLITGPAGSGKTTTLATLVDMINQTRNDHIVSIEQPIEIVFEPKQCQITQREINLHTVSQHNALRAALREDPDILIISELRDLQTVQLAISAAETGHLVFGTMNTVNAAQTISRIIDSFPSEEQPIIRNMLSESLRGVICQQLIPKIDGSGMAVAYEVLIVNQSIANLIREGRTGQISNAITTGRNAGMILLENSLQALVLNGQISATQACEYSTNPSMMMQLLNT